MIVVINLKAQEKSNRYIFGSLFFLPDISHCFKCSIFFLPFAAKHCHTGFLSFFSVNQKGNEMKAMQLAPALFKRIVNWRVELEIECKFSFSL